MVCLQVESLRCPGLRSPELSERKNIREARTLSKHTFMGVSVNTHGEGCMSNGAEWRFILSVSRTGAIRMSKISLDVTIRLAAAISPAISLPLTAWPVPVDLGTDDIGL